MANGGPWVRGVLSALVTVVAVAVVGLGVFAWDRLARPEQTTIPITTVVPQAPSDCARAQPTLFAALSGHLAQPTDRFGSRQYALDDGGLTYVTAPVGNASGGLRATDPVWVYGGSGYAWLNEPARRLSSGLPDAQRTYGADPAGPLASRIASCAGSGS